MKTTTLSLLIAILTSTILQAKIIEVEDGSSFIGTYVVDARSTIGCKAQDAFNNEVQVLGLNNYSGLKVVSSIGQHGQGSQELFKFDLNEHGKNGNMVQYIGSEEIESGILTSNQSGDMFATYQSMKVVGPGHIELMKTVLGQDKQSKDFSKVVSQTICLYLKK